MLRHAPSAMVSAHSKNRQYFRDLPLGRRVAAHGKGEVLFFLIQGFGASLLSRKDFQRGLGGVAADTGAGEQALAQGVLGAVHGENMEGNAQPFGQCAGGLAWSRRKVGGVEDDSQTGLHHLFGQRQQAGVGLFAGLRAIAPGEEPIFAALREEALAFDVGTDADQACALGQDEGSVALAAARIAVGDEKLRLAGLGVALGQIDVACITGSGLHDLLRRAAEGDAKQGDFGAHHGAVSLVEAQQGQPRIVAAVFQITVEQAAGMGWQAAVFQVHEQEGQLAHHVDPAEAVVEFDGVEDDDGIVHQGHIAKVHVAVQLAHETFPLASGKDGRKARIGALGPQA